MKNPLPLHQGQMATDQSKFERYGLRFNAEQFDNAQVERYMLQQGGLWTDEKGQSFGNGLEYHFKQYWSLLWPEDDQTWWTDLILKNVLANQFTSLVGPASSWKSGTIGRIALMDWSLFPDCTSILMSSTDMEGLRARIYGETTMLWRRASERHEWFPGHPIDHKCVITNEDVEEEKARDLRNSIVGVPCKTASGQFIGMGKYAGRKNRRVWCIADEFAFMHLSILQGQDNLISNGGNLIPGIVRDATRKDNGKPLPGYKCVFILNPNPSVPNNPGDVVSEPEASWGSIPDDGKTKVWKCKKHPQHPVKCVCINLDSLDSPNTPYPLDKPKFQNLAGPHKLLNYTEGSESYYSQGRGVFKFGLAAFKIITKEVCDQFHAFDSLTWEGSSPTTKIGMCDAAYGIVGGDRCPVGWLEFGKCVDGVIRLWVREYWLVPIVFKKDCIPEDQIAMFCKEKMESAGVPPENFFFDGRGSLAMSFARAWSPAVNAVEFGGIPTERPAGPDLYTMGEHGVRRLQTARERYVNFCSELWWAWRYVVESDQMRGLLLEIVIDGQPREWKKIRNDKIQVETKRDMKKRTGISPDLADMLVVGIEGARRKGFSISKLAIPDKNISKGSQFLQKQADKYAQLLKSKQLTSA